MNLDDAQRKKVIEWIAQGLKLSEIQTRLASEMKITMTYMDVRLLVDDLKLTPKDPEPVKPAKSAADDTHVAKPMDTDASDSLEPEAPAGTGAVSVKVDQLARPGAMASGKVTFSDGKSADWYFDQNGQLGLVPQQAGYRPPASDVQQFQKALDAELSKMGL